MGDNWSNWGAVIAGAAVAYVVGRLLRRPSATPTTGDAEWLARVTMLEHARASVDEWAAIMYVALNRAQARGVSVRDVVASVSWPGGGPRGRAFVEAVQAAGGRGYLSPYGHPAPPDVPQFPAALELARAIVAGNVANPIGARTHFVHPQSLPRCGPEAPPTPGRLCVDGRAFPAWAVARSAGGTAEFTPLRVGAAVFA